MKRSYVFLLLVCFSASICYAQQTAWQKYVGFSTSYNIADIPRYLPYHSYGSNNYQYYYYYQNNLSFNLYYSIGREKVFYKLEVAFEKQRLLSDTAEIPSSCGTLKYTLQSKGDYLGVSNGLEFFPIEKLKFISFGLDVFLGYSSTATKSKIVIIGCERSDVWARKLFFTTSAFLNGYITISDKFDFSLNLRYQLRGDHIDFFTHVDYGFGIGCRYKITK